MEVATAAGKAARALAGFVFGTLVLVSAIYGVVLLINRHDEPPSVDARRLEQLIDARPAVAAADNAYVYLLGMTAIDGEDPVVLGRKRQDFIEAYPVSGGFAAAGTWPGADRNRVPSATAREIGGACREDGAACLRVLAQNPAAVEAWLAASTVELDRYRTLIARAGWRESIPRSIVAPLPAWKPALDGQRLWLLSAWQRAHAGETDAVMAALEADLLFWRKLLRESDLFITKMVATAAIRHHFAIGNLVVRELHRTGGVTDVPASWREPISPEERSLLRAVAGEWRFAGGAIALVVAEQQGAAQAMSLDGAIGRLSKPLFQPQASLNLHAAQLVRLAESAQAPYPQLRQSVEAATQPARVAWYRRLYNPVGQVFSSVAGPAYADYALRIADVEAMRRMALLAAELRARSAVANTPEQTTHDIVSASLRDPFSEQAFGWDAPAAVLEFLPRGHSEGRSPYRMPL